MPDPQPTSETGSSRQRPSGNRLQRLWRVLRSPSIHWSILSLVGGGLLVGAFCIVALNIVLHATSSTEFCATCHAQNAVVDWKQSSHYSNRTGFVVGCAECHVPQNLFKRMAREVRVPNEIWNHFAGAISTPEKYEAHRLAMAEIEWARLRKNNSQECRDCHHLDLMTDKGKPNVSDAHKVALSAGQTCIECHKGVAHKAPSESPTSSAK